MMFDCKQKRDPGLACSRMLRPFGLRLVLTVGFDLEAADEQCRQDILSLVIGPDADATTTWRNVGVIMRRNIVLTTVGRIHHERLKWLSSQPVSDVLRHAPNLAKDGPYAIPAGIAERPA